MHPISASSLNATYRGLLYLCEKKLSKTFDMSKSKLYETADYQYASESLIFIKNC